MTDTSPPVYSLADGRPAAIPRFSGALFIVCGGPSLKITKLELLSRRGIAVMTVNNAWALIKPQFSVTVDPPKNFTNLGWMDPSIPYKFCPIDFLKGIIWRRVGDEFVTSPYVASQMPGMVFYRRHLAFDSSKYFKRDTPVCWGHPKSTPDSEGVRGGKSVMHAAIRIAYDLGFRHLRLVGADFHMSPKPGQQYGFDQQKDARACQFNNMTYDALMQRLPVINALLRREGGSLVNCTVGGRLDSIPRMDLEEAVSRASSLWAGGITTAGWYHEKKDTKPQPADDVKEIYRV